MASLQQALEGIPITLHCHKSKWGIELTIFFTDTTFVWAVFIVVIELLQTPSIQQDAALSNHALQYLRIKAIKVNQRLFEQWSSNIYLFLSFKPTG
jgi:hypothetical protein